MARPLRMTYAGAVHHVTLRGNDRRDIFLDDGDREHFIRKLAESIRLYDIRLYLYAQMQNHVHLVLETPQDNLSRFMQRLQTAYIVYFQRKHRRSGHLLQGRFGSTLVEGDEYLLKLSRYVHLNPVFTKAHAKKTNRERLQILRSYPWSTYPSYTGIARRLEFIDYNTVLAMMGGSLKQQAATYRRFIEAGIREIDAPFIDTKRRSRFCIGSEKDQEKAEALYQEMVQEYDSKEDVSFRRVGTTLPVEAVLPTVLEILDVPETSIKHRCRNSMARPVIAYALCRFSGCTQRTVAEVMGLSSGAAVSLQLKRLHEQLKSDRRLRAAVEKLDRRLCMKE